MKHTNETINGFTNEITNEITVLIPLIPLLMKQSCETLFNENKF